MNKTSFSILSKNQDIKIDTNQITSGYDGLNSFLNLFISFTFRKPSKRIVFDVVSISAKLKFLTPDILLSETILLTNLLVNNVEDNKGEWFNFILDDKAISIIEKFRKDDVRFNVELTFQIQIKEEFYTENKELILSARGLQKEKVNLQFSIPKSIWVEKILQNLGYQNLKLIEIPLTHKTLKEAYDDIVFEFNKAEEYFNQKDYNKCVAHCRCTLDALTRNLKKIKQQTASETAFDWLKAIDYATFNWIDELNKANTALSGKTHHAGQKRDFSRQEAESIYLVILGLLNFIAHIK